MKRTVSSILLLAAAVSAGCAANPAGVSSGAASSRFPAQPAGWADELALPAAADRNPDPRVIEFDLEARIVEMEIVPGTRTPVWTYNGTLPGPMIKANVGDRVIIHFRNSLPEPTSIHWHGLRVPNAMDGVPGATQGHIQPGEEFTYEFVLDDAGTFWYHPHVDSAVQVGRGLYGPIVVNDPRDPEVFGDELVLMFSDMSLDAEGQFLPDDAGGAFGDLFGREGSILLVNGKVMPTLQVRQGLQQRWRIINAARTRYYTIRYPSAQLVRLGGDNGLAERSQTLNQLVLVPGERADLVFTPPDSPGTQSALLWYPTERGYGSTFDRKPEPMMAIRTIEDAPVEPRAIPEQLRRIERVDTAGAPEAHIDLTIAMTDQEEVIMGINGIDGRHHVHDGEPNLEARVGETYVWRVTNNTDFAHPFHLHGFFFQVLDDRRVPEWKDTVDVPAKSEIRLAVRFDDRPGMWMFHCHILDHAELGMMGLIRLNP